MAIRFDQGREFLADAVRVAAGALAIEIRPQPGYTPHLKGVIERLNESIEQLFLAELPGFLHGATDRARRPIDPAAPLLSFEPLVELFAEFVARYNERPHKGIDGTTPWKRWESDPTPLHTVPAERLRHLMLATKRRTVTKHGVRLKRVAVVVAENRADMASQSTA